MRRQQRGIAGLVAEVVTELTAGELRTAIGLGGNELGFLSVQQVVTHEGEGDSTEVGTTTKAANHHIGIFACHGHLLLCLQVS